MNHDDGSLEGCVLCAVVAGYGGCYCNAPRNRMQAWWRNQPTLSRVLRASRELPRLAWGREHGGWSAQRVDWTWASRGNIRRALAVVSVRQSGKSQGGVAWSMVLN